MKREERIINILSAGIVIVFAMICVSLITIIPFGKLTGYAVEGSSDSNSTNEWAMFGRTLNHTSYDGQAFTVIGGLNNVNFTTLNSLYYSSPVIANGYVYIGSLDKNVYQLNASNISQQIANYRTGGYIYSSPAVANGHVYIGNNDGKVYQLNASNVSQNIANYTTANSVFSSPAVANGYVYIGSLDYNLYQLNASNISQQIANFTTLNNIGYSSPAVANGYVYIGSYDNYVYQLNASNISQHIANYSTGGVIYSSPAVANGYVYIGSYDNYVYQLNASNVSQHIANYTTGNPVFSSPAVANGYVYIGSEDIKVYQLNASNISQQIATYDTGGLIFPSPAVANGYVYIGSNDKNFYQLNASNISQQIATYNTGGTVYSSPAVANGYVYIGNWDNYALYQLNASNISLRNNFPACVESWECSIWNICSNSIQTRTCIDVHSCGTTLLKPAESQNCEEHLGLPPTETNVATSTQSIPQSTSEAPVEVIINNQALSLTSIILSLNNPTEQGTIEVKETTPKTSSSTFSWGSRRYKSFEINFKGVNKSNIANATLNIKVEKNWLDKNNLTFFIEGKNYTIFNNSGVGGIKIYRDEYGNNSWMSLDTTLIKQDEKYYYFSALSPGFSIFDVLFEAYGCVPNNLKCNGNVIELCVEGTSWRGIELCDYQCKNNKCIISPPTFNQLYFFVVTGMISATFVVAVFLGLKLRKRK